MSSDALLERFLRQSPITVMLQATLVNAYSPAALDALFVDSAQKQYEGELLFSSVVDLLALVVWRQKRSVGQAYQHAQRQFHVSVRSVYNKLNGTEPQVCRELVRRPAEPLGQVVEALGGRKPKLPGYRTRIIDGNKLTSTDHRLKPLRTTKSGPLPGMALAVLDPDRLLMVDLFCCEDGEAQERRLFPQVIESASRGELWIADRNFCTTGFLFGLARKRASFVIRQHGSTLSWQKESPPRKIGRCETGLMYEQILHLENQDKALEDKDRRLLVRRVTIQLDKPTTSGETEIHLLTNLPRRHATHAQVARLYLTRWTIENAFQEIEQSLRSEIDTLGYPGAALLGFAIAVMTYNALSVIKTAIASEHAGEVRREELSGYYLAAMVASDYGGMLIALPPEEWTSRYAQLSPEQLAQRLRTCARCVRPELYRKRVRGPKRPRPKRTSGAVYHHVSTAQLIRKQQQT